MHSCFYSIILDMKNKKKHFITAILATLFLILVLYLIFHDSLGEIKTQLFQADKKALLILVIFGNLYVLLDGGHDNGIAGFAIKKGVTYQVTPKGGQT